MTLLAAGEEQQVETKKKVGDEAKSKPDAQILRRQYFHHLRHPLGFLLSHPPSHRRHHHLPRFPPPLPPPPPASLPPSGALSVSVPASVYLSLSP
jgi:hypothetical protein